MARFADSRADSGAEMALGGDGRRRNNIERPADDMPADITGSGY